MIAPTEFTAHLLIAMWRDRALHTAAELEKMIVGIDIGSARTMGRHLAALVETHLVVRHEGRPPMFEPTWPPRRIPIGWRGYYTRLGVRLERVADDAEDIAPIMTSFMIELAQRQRLPPVNGYPSFQVPRTRKRPDP